MIKTNRLRSECIVLVTAPDRKIARSLANACLNRKLAACVNLVPGVESHYWWKGRKERSSEILLLIKTRRACLKELEQVILREHPYDVPEFVVLGLQGGNRRYLSWIAAETTV